MSFVLRQTREFSLGNPEERGLEFRIEIFERTGAGPGDHRFRVRIWLYDMVRLTLIPGMFRAKFFDNSLLTHFDLFDPLEFSLGTPDEAAEACIARLKEWLYHQ